MTASELHAAGLRYLSQATMWTGDFVQDLQARPARPPELQYQLLALANSYFAAALAAAAIEKGPSCEEPSAVSPSSAG